MKTLGGGSDGYIQKVVLVWELFFFFFFLFAACHFHVLCLIIGQYILKHPRRSNSTNAEASQHNT